MLEKIRLPVKNPFDGFAWPMPVNLGTLPNLGGMRTVLWVTFGLLLVAVVYLAQFSNAAILAHSLQNKQAQIEELKRENAQLQYEIAAATSPDSIQLRAQKLGLGPAKNIVYANLPALQPEDAQLLPKLAVPPVPEISQDLTVAVPSPWEQILALFGLGTSSSAQAQSK